jgi:hypothetical protein
MPRSSLIPAPDNGIAHTADKGHLPHIMHPDHVSPVAYAYGKRRRGSLQQRFTIRTQHIAYKRFPGSSNQNRQPERFQISEFTHNLKVLTACLAEPDAGVDYQVVPGDTGVQG